MKQAFITLKDHKTNFENNLPCRLINPAKSETGLVSKIILDRINNAVRAATAVNQWRSSTAVLEWFRNIQEKDRHTFTSFDIVEFYPSITESLLKKAITFVKKHTQVSKQDIKIVMHARKSLLFDKDTPWKKKDSNELFDVTMGSYDGAEICELVGLYTLSILTKRYGKEKRRRTSGLQRHLRQQDRQHQKGDNKYIQRTRPKHHHRQQPENHELP